MQLPIDIARLCMIYAVEPLCKFIDIIPKEISKNLNSIMNIMDNPKAYRYIRKLINRNMSMYFDGKISEKQLGKILQTNIWKNPHPKILNMVEKLANLLRTNYVEYSCLLLANPNIKARELASPHVFKKYEPDFSSGDSDALSVIIEHIDDIYYISYHLERSKNNNGDDYEMLCAAASANSNPKIVEFLLSEKGTEYLVNKKFSTNSSDIAVDYLIAHPNKINWVSIQANKNPRALKLFIEYQTKNKLNVYPYTLGANPTFIDFVMEDPELIKLIRPNSLNSLSANSNPKLLDLIATNPELAKAIDTSYLFKYNHGVLQNTYGPRFINKLVISIAEKLNKIITDSLI